MLGLSESETNSKIFASGSRKIREKNLLGVKKYPFQEQDQPVRSVTQKCIFCLKLIIPFKEFS